MVRYAKILISICILSGLVFLAIYFKTFNSAKEIAGATGAAVVKLLKFSSATEKKYYRHLVWQSLSEGSAVLDGEEIRIEGDGFAEIEVLPPFAVGLIYRVLGGSDVLFKKVNNCDETLRAEGLLVMVHSGQMILQGSSAVAATPTLVPSPAPEKNIIAGEIICLSGGKVAWRSKTNRNSN